MPCSQGRVGGGAGLPLPLLLFSLSLGAKPKLFHEHKSISLSKSHFIWVEKKTGLKKFMKFPLFLPY